jgi:phospholipase C
VQGAWYIQETLDALTAVPDVWSKTVLLVDYDENDGYFDHVPSPSAPSINAGGTHAGMTTLRESDIAFERFTHPNPPGTTNQPPPDGRVYGPGMRVPLFVISPWSRGGWVNSQVFDHTSVLRFLEKRFGVKEPNISRYRRAVCGDLMSAFNFERPNDEVLPTLPGRKTLSEADALRADQEKLPVIPPPANPMFPVQTIGVRPSRALPYELHTSARCDVARGKVKLIFANSGDAAAVFHVYDKLHLERLPRRYAVEPNERLDDDWSAMADNGGRYDLWVLGPNGFHRHFKGDLNSLRARNAPNPEIRVGYQARSGELHLKLRNDGERTCVFTVKPLAYRKDGPWTARVKGGDDVELHWDTDNSGFWYDFAVTCDSDPAYYRRLAGRIETGRHAVSDPAMGTGDT